jgi:hypothetical protein
MLIATWFVIAGAFVYFGAGVFYAYNTQYVLSMIYFAYTFANIGLALIGEGFR